VPGQIRRCRVAELAEPAALSSHAPSLVQAFDLGQALGRVPEHLVLFMVDVTDTRDGVGCRTPRRPPCPQPSRWWRQTYTVGGTESSLARRAGADLRLLQKTMGHASTTVTAHIYADLYDDELDDIASALDALDDTRGDLP
jgi:hypothetical protein